MDDKKSQKQDKQYLVPMEITLEAARDFGIDPKDIIWFPPGTQKCMVYLVPASREVYLAYMQPIRAEARRMIQDKFLSPSALMDAEAEPAAESFEDDVIHSILFRELIAMLTEIAPKFGEIFSMLCDGATQQKISDKLGIKPQAVSDDIKKIRSILQPLAEDFRG